MSATAEPLAGPLLPGLGHRPAWQIRGFFRPGGDGPTVSFRVPAGYAETPGQALDRARKIMPDVMRALPTNRWRAFPIDDPGPRIL